MKRPRICPACRSRQYPTQVVTRCQYCERLIHWPGADLASGELNVDKRVVLQPGLFTI